MIDFPALPTVPEQTTVATSHMAKPGRRAPMLPPHVAEIAADVPAVAAALDKLNAALDALEESASKMDELADEHDDDRAAVKAAALAGKVKAPKPAEFWEARRDAIVAAHEALMPPAVNAQFAVAEAAAPYVEERIERDRQEIRQAADRLAVLIERSTGYSAQSVVVDGRERLGSVADMLRGLRVVAGGLR